MHLLSACLRALYGIPAAPATQSSNKIAVPGFVGQYAQQADLSVSLLERRLLSSTKVDRVQDFLKLMRPDMPSSTTFSTQLLDGGENPQDPSQASLEAVSYLMSCYSQGERSSCGCA